MGETSETLRITMTVTEAQELSDFLSRNKQYEFQPCVDEENETWTDTNMALVNLRVSNNVNIKIQMAILRSQL